MKIREDPAGDTQEVVRRIERSGYAVSVHHMSEYVELHAVHLAGDGPNHIARCEGDGDVQTYQAVRVLAAMVGVAVSDARGYDKRRHI